MTTDDALLGAITDLRGDMGRRFEGVTAQIDAVDCKVDLIDGRIGKLETTHMVDVAVAATKAAMLASQREDDMQRQNVAESHALTSIQRKGLWVAALGAIVASTAGVVDTAAHLMGAWR